MGTGGALLPDLVRADYISISIVWCLARNFSFVDLLCIRICSADWILPPVRNGLVSFITWYLTMTRKRHRPLTLNVHVRIACSEKSDSGHCHLFSWFSFHRMLGLAGTHEIENFYSLCWQFKLARALFLLQLVKVDHGFTFRAILRNGREHWDLLRLFWCQGSDLPGHVDGLSWNSNRQHRSKNQTATRIAVGNQEKIKHESQKDRFSVNIAQIELSVRHTCAYKAWVTSKGWNEFLPHTHNSVVKIPKTLRSPLACLCLIYQGLGDYLTLAIHTM